MGKKIPPTTIGGKNKHPRGDEMSNVIHQTLSPCNQKETTKKKNLHKKEGGDE